jgi:hypothetical protein
LRESIRNAKNDSIRKASDAFACKITDHADAAIFFDKIREFNTEERVYKLIESINNTPDDVSSAKIHPYVTVVIYLVPLIISILNIIWGLSG